MTPEQAFEIWYNIHWFHMSQYDFENQSEFTTWKSQIKEAFIAGFKFCND